MISISNKATLEEKKSRRKSKSKETKPVVVEDTNLITVTETSLESTQTISKESKAKHLGINFYRLNIILVGDTFYLTQSYCNFDSVTCGKGESKTKLNDLLKIKYPELYQDLLDGAILGDVSLENVTLNKVNSSFVNDDNDICLEVSLILHPGWDLLLVDKEDNNNLVELNNLLASLPETLRFNVKYISETDSDPIVSYEMLNYCDFLDFYNRLRCVELRKNFIDYSKKDITSGIKNLYNAIKKSKDSGDVFIIPEFVFYASSMNKYEYQPEDIMVLISKISSSLQEDYKIGKPLFIVYSTDYDIKFLRGVDTICYPDENIIEYLEDGSSDITLSESNISQGDYELIKDLGNSVEELKEDVVASAVEKVVNYVEEVVNRFETEKVEKQQEYLILSDDSGVLDVINSTEHINLLNVFFDKRGLFTDLDSLSKLLKMIDSEDITGGDDNYRKEIIRSFNLDIENIVTPKDIIYYFGLRPTLDIKQYYTNRYMKNVADLALDIQSKVSVGNFISYFLVVTDYNGGLSSIKEFTVKVIDKFNLFGRAYLLVEENEDRFFIGLGSVSKINGYLDIATAIENQTLSQKYMFKIVNEGASTELLGVSVDIESSSLRIEEENVQPMTFVNMLSDILQVKYSSDKDMDNKKEIYYTMLESKLEEISILLEKI